jgi:hypothetical protein
MASDLRERYPAPSIEFPRFPERRALFAHSRMPKLNAEVIARDHPAD